MTQQLDKMPLRHGKRKNAVVSATFQKLPISPFYWSNSCNLTVLLLLTPFLPTVKGLYKNRCTMKLTWLLRSILFFDRVQLDHCAVGTNTRQPVSREIPSHTRSQNLEPCESLLLQKKIKYYGWSTL